MGCLNAFCFGCVGWFGSGCWGIPGLMDGWMDGGWIGVKRWGDGVGGIIQFE